MRRLQVLEAIADEALRQEAKREPSSLDQAINEALKATRPSERRQAKRLFNRLQEFV